jgi:hypothetical protein
MSRGESWLPQPAVLAKTNRTATGLAKDFILALASRRHLLDSRLVSLIEVLRRIPFRGKNLPIGRDRLHGRSPLDTQLLGIRTLLTNRAKLGVRMFRDVARRMVGGGSLPRDLVLLASARRRIPMGTFQLAWMCLPNSHSRTWCATLFLWLFQFESPCHVVDVHFARFRSVCM